jgi:hypothetical protein
MEASFGAATLDASGTRSTPVCAHDGYHSITTRYDREAGVLIYMCQCDGCGGTIGEIQRLPYRLRFDPAGNDRFPGRAA